MPTGFFWVPIFSGSLSFRLAVPLASRWYSPVDSSGCFFFQGCRFLHRGPGGRKQLTTVLALGECWHENLPATRRAILLQPTGVCHRNKKEFFKLSPGVFSHSLHSKIPEDRSLVKFAPTGYIDPAALHAMPNLIDFPKRSDIPCALPSTGVDSHGPLLAGVES